ncbi:SPW repeat protein [Hymenobacter sp.]|uniref:SPW repeat domain-containing protein n=1 Tax=Hymenobacter sp. TaxID=1898978 RepID=UPI00286B4984|nr:SPW repeat protein [Hymenobacter sp.]
MKAISPTVHGLLDYATCAFFALAPWLFGFAGAYATVCYVLAGGYLVVSLLTNMPLALVRVLPFPLHGKLELVSGLVFLASPWLFGFANDNETARNLFVAAGAVFLVVYALTDWYAQTRGAGLRGHTITGAGVQDS